MSISGLSQKIADEEIDLWDFNNSIKDKEILRDVESALMEAYIRGIKAGGIDKDLFEESLEIII